MSAADKVEIVSSAGTQAARVLAGVLQTSAGSNTPPTARAQKVVIVDPVTGNPADVTLGALVTT